MKTHALVLVALVLGLPAPSVMAHGRSELMTKELNASPPEWLSIGVPIKVELSQSPPVDREAFRSRSGGATNSSNRVQIPDRGIEIKLDYEIDWTGNNEAGTAVSLSPNGRKLIVNAGPTSRVYDIHDDGTYREVPLQLPHVTYDDGRKGYLYGWSWADDQTLVARAEIIDEAGHEILENRIYVFHLKQSVLSRLDLSALSLADTDVIEVIGIGKDLSQLKLSAGNTVVIAKADLKSPPKIGQKESIPSTATSALVAPEQLPPRQAEENPTVPTPSEGATSSIPWSIIVVLIVAACGLLWLLLKRRTK
jgi:hypothetical protein